MPAVKTREYKSLWFTKAPVHLLQAEGKILTSTTGTKKEQTSSDSDSKKPFFREDNSSK